MVRVFMGGTGQSLKNAQSLAMCDVGGIACGQVERKGETACKGESSRDLRFGDLTAAS